jgi:hypothetical protein
MTVISEPRASGCNIEAASDVIKMALSEIEHTYATPQQRAAYRAGLSTAAALCDAKGTDFYADGSSIRSRTASSAATKCGDAIAELRDLIHVRDLPTPQHEPGVLDAQ